MNDIKSGKFLKANKNAREARSRGFLSCQQLVVTASLFTHAKENANEESAKNVGVRGGVRNRSEQEE